jgi:hypothetical protein
MDRTQLVSVGLALALVVTGVTIGAAPAAADSDDPVLDGVFSDDDGNETSIADRVASGASALRAGLGGLQDRAGFWVSQTVGDRVPALAGDQTSAADQASALTTYYRANHETLERYVNARRNFSGDRTVEVTIKLNGEEETRYLLANESNGNVTTSVVSSTSRTVNEDLTVCGFAAQSSYEELKHFTENYAEPGKDVDASYKARLASRYGDDVETSLYPAGGDCSEDS